MIVHVKMRILGLVILKFDCLHTTIVVVIMVIVVLHSIAITITITITLIMIMIIMIMIMITIIMITIIQFVMILIMLGFSFVERCFIARVTLTLMKGLILAIIMTTTSYSKSVSMAVNLLSLFFQ